jgi:hypothetical protein
MREELVLSCFYNPISGSPKNPIILINYVYFGIASTEKRENLKKIQKFFGLAGISGKRSGFQPWMGLFNMLYQFKLDIAERTADKAI